MSGCEEWPVCGHGKYRSECPDFDPETGKQLNMKCVCGATVPLGGSSICAGCLNPPPGHPDFDGADYYDDDPYDPGDDE